MEKFFKVKERGSTVRTEVIAGVTTFMAMVYILMVNAGMFADPFGDGTNVLGVSYGAIYICTAISAIVGTVLIGLLANLPMAQAPAMGLNAFFVYTICVGMGLSYANALVFILIDGLIFILLTITGLRKILFNAIPDAVKAAIPAGIGLFIAFIGLQNVGLVVNNASTCVGLMSFNLLAGATWGSIMPVLVTILAVAVIAILEVKKVRGSILWGILGGAVAYYLLGLTVPGFYQNFSVGAMNPFAAFGEFGTQAFGKVFTEGFDFSGYIAANGAGSLVLVLITTSFAFCVVDMFDTMGTLYGACARGNLLTEEGGVPNVEQAMLADAIATTTGAICGTSTVTTYVESAAGVAEGGKTGLTSIVTAALFVVAMFLSPVAALIPTYATSAALIFVGVLMMNCVKDIEWTKAEVAVPAFLTVVMMPMTYNISFGIAFGMISYLIIKIGSGKIKDITIGAWVITILFLAMFLLSH